MKPKKKQKTRVYKKNRGVDASDLPESDNLNIWDPEWGWVLKYGRATRTYAAYLLRKMREKVGTQD